MGQGSQQSSAEGLVESFTKILLDNEKVSHADVNVQMRLKNVRSNLRKRNVRFYSYVNEINSLLILIKIFFVQI